jgi:hypothetical protein
MAKAGHELSQPKRLLGVTCLPPDRSGFREERLGSVISHHLTTFVESTIMNVGGSGMNAKVSSPPMKRMGVGGVIVLGGWESRLQGEGRQLVGISTQNSRMRTGMKFP